MIIKIFSEVVFHNASVVPQDKPSNLQQKNNTGHCKKKSLKLICTKHFVTSLILLREYKETKKSVPDIYINATFMQLINWNQ